MADHDGGEPDPAMLELFRAELDTHLPTLSHGLLSLEKGHVEDSQIEGMMRAAHSIKGAARIVGVSMAVQVAHAMEDCFTGAQNQQITLTSEAVDVLLNAVDVLQQICDPTLNQAVDEQTIQALLLRIEHIKQGKKLHPKQSLPPESNPPSPPVAKSSSPLDAHIELPITLNDAAAEKLRLDLVDFLESTPERIELNFQQVKEMSALALAVIVAFVRESLGQRPHLDITFTGVPQPIATVFRVTDLADLLDGKGKADDHAR